MTDQWTDRLSDYLDDELSAQERHGLEAHLADCASCQTVLSELRAIVEQAKKLQEAEPGWDLWPAIAARVRATPQERTWWTRLTSGRVSLSLPQLAGAAAAVVIVTAAVMLSRDAPSSRSMPADASQSPASPVTMANFADPQYDAAVADLKRALEAGRGRLDPETVVVLERNLMAIDSAIVQAREALATDPANAYLNSYLAEARRRKLDLLRRVTDLTS
jgi:hypothetical protein